jgi:arylsulfatase A-like enzyme
VLLVTIDTLRADAVGKKSQAPAIRGFLDQATHFQRARTVTPLTLPSHASMFTGLLPAGHGIHDNVTEPLPPRDARRFPLLAEQMRDAGYGTAAFVARAVLAEATGIGSGFDVYECPEGDESTGYIQAEERIKAALKWIEGAPRGRPWFVWVHLFDPHAPYRPYPGDELRAGTRETDPPATLYAGEVRRADAAFGKLLRAVGPGTVVVLASDHGEGLGDHDEPTHGPLCYGSTIDAVLAVRAPGFKRGAVDLGLRGVADIAPTLRRLCSLPAAEAHGKDLNGTPHETLVSESLFTWGIHGWGQVFGVTDGEFTLIESGSRLELFDRRADPGETTPLPITHPAYEKLDRALERFRSQPDDSGDDGERLASVPPYGELRRRASGYLARRENAALPDPRERLKDWALLEGVIPLVQMCRTRRDGEPLQRSLELLQVLERSSPMSPRIDHYRAQVFAALAEITGETERFTEAAWAELGAIEKGYVQDETIQPAIEYALRANDAEALRTLGLLLRRERVRLGEETARAFREASAKLKVETEAPMSTRTGG